jgi:hypothetical protein
MFSPFSLNPQADLRTIRRLHKSINIKCALDDSNYIHRNAGCQIEVVNNFVQYAQVTNL